MWSEFRLVGSDLRQVELSREIDLFKKESQYSCLLLCGYSATIDFDESAVKASLIPRKGSSEVGALPYILMVFAVLYLWKLAFKY